MKAFFILFLFLLQARGTDIRLATFNVLNGIDAPGTMSHDSIRDILARIDADVVGLQEVFAFDRNSNNGNPSNLESLATSLGYSHIFVPDGIALDTNSRVVLISKFPFISTHSIASPSGARDVARPHAAALVDVPGTDADPTIITLHLKCCFDSDDFFRRAVEIERIKLFLTDQNLTGADNIMIMGDYNLLGTDSVYNSLPSGLPASYVLGPDITFPVSYFANPELYFVEAPLFNPDPRQQNGIASATHSSGATLDYFVISEALSDRGPVLEIYNSEFESTDPGLPKSGEPLAFGISDQASDHLPIFGDFDLDGNILPLGLTLSSSSLIEGGPAAQITVTLPNAPLANESVTVLLSSSDCLEAMPENLTLTFGPGVTTQTGLLIPQVDSIIDGTQSVTITASATGFSGASSSVSVEDRDSPVYSLSALNSPIIEEFTGFQGEQAPAGWTSSPLSFQGFEDGTSITQGPRSYGTQSDGSLGIFASEESILTSHFQNDTGNTITSLNLSYTAEQWRSFFNGGQDQIEVSLITPSGSLIIPELAFTAANDLETGPIELGNSTLLSTTLSNLSIPASTPFQLQFRILPGAPGATGGDSAFINEIHYDNDGADQDEFVEIVLGPNFAGDISELSLHFYNGNNGSEYMSHQFTAADLNETLSTGHQVYSVSLAGIQNGSPDGLALAFNSTILQFLSYEGEFTANEGPALGMMSSDIGVSQNSTHEAGSRSVGLAGEGSDPDSFQWIRGDGPFTQGTANENQSFGATTLGQGIAIDNLIVSALPQSTQVSISSDFLLTFPTEVGISYIVERSTDLQTWNEFATRTGDGALAIIDIADDFPQLFFRVRQSSL